MTTFHNQLFYIGIWRGHDKVCLASMSYGGKNIESSAVKDMLREVTLKTDQLYSFAMNELAWSLMKLEEIIYVVVTHVEYPSRVTSLCLRDTARLFTSRIQNNWKDCREMGLQEACRTLLRKLCEKFDNLDEMDKLTNTMSKVEAVKLQMQKNIEQTLENSVTLKKIEDDTDDLIVSAGIFKKQAQTLKNKMWWKNCKMKMIIGLIVTGVFLGILCLILYNVGVFDEDDDDD